MPRFPSAQGRLNHEPDSTLAVTKTCPKDGVHLSQLCALPIDHRQLFPHMARDQSASRGPMKLRSALSIWV